MGQFTYTLLRTAAISALLAGAAPAADSAGPPLSVAASEIPLGNAAGGDFRLRDGAVVPGKAIALDNPAEARGLRVPGVGVATHSQSASGAIHLSGAVMQDLALRLAPEAGTLPSLAAGVALLWGLQDRRRHR